MRVLMALVLCVPLAGCFSLAALKHLLINFSFG